jgi:hypothetical protein
MFFSEFGTKENYVFYLLILIRAKVFYVQIGNSIATGEPIEGFILKLKKKKYFT